MPGPRGRAPTSRARLTPSKTFDASSPICDPGERREGAVVELHDDALERLERGGDLEQAQLHRGVGPEQGTARDAEQEAVADLAGGAGDGDLDGGSAHRKALHIGVSLDAPTLPVARAPSGRAAVLNGDSWPHA